MSYFDEDEIEEIAEGEVKVKPEGITATVNLGDSAIEGIANGIAYRLEQSIARRIEKAVGDRVSDLVNEAVRKVIGDKIEPLILAELDKPRQKFNEWGTPYGPTVAFSDQIPGVVTAWMEAKVNDKGFSDGYGKVKRAEWIIATQVREHIDPITTNAVATVTKQARDVVAQKIAAFVSEQMIPAIEMKKF